MSQCVPSWDIDDNPASAPKLCFRSHSNSSTPDVPMLDYEVAELTWKNGHLAMHGLGPPRVPLKPIPPSSSPSKYGTTWDKPRAGGTLESIVNQATRMPFEQLINKPMVVVSGAGGGQVDELVPWFDHHRAAAVVAAASASASASMTMDAMVPCSNGTSNHHQQDRAAAAHLMESSHQGQGACSTRVGSCSTQQDTDAGFVGAKRARVARVPLAPTPTPTPTPPEWSSRDQSVSQSATFRDSQHVTMGTCEREMGFGFTSTSFGSHENTSSGQQGTKTVTGDENDSVCHSRPQREGGDHEEGQTKGNGKSSVSTKRSRAAAIHNQSERKRRDKINQRMKTLQKLVPNSSKTDKASMLDEVIEYLKQLQAQIQMMGRMNMQPMMMPMAMQQQLQQQLQMSMMAPMTMGMGIGMGMGMMDMNAINRTPNMSPVLHPNAFMPMHSWDGSYDRLQTTPTAPTTAKPDPMQAAFLACQSQPMSMDAYSRMAAMYQQLHQQNNASSYKN